MARKKKIVDPTPRRKPDPTKPISLSEYNWMDYIDVDYKGKVVDLSEIKDARTKRNILEDIDKVNRMQQEAFLDSTKYFNETTAFNNEFKRHRSSLVDEHDPMASRHNPFNDTPTVDRNEALRWVDELDTRGYGIADIVNESPWFRSPDATPDILDLAYLHTDLPYRGRDGFKNSVHVFAGQYSPTKPTKPTPYTIVDPSVGSSTAYPTTPPKPSYQQIPTKQPYLRSSPLPNDQLTPTQVEPITRYPEDVHRFTAGDYLESQDKSSGYVNYGDNKGRVEMKKYGGQMSNRRKLSKDEILRNIAAGKYILGGDTGVTPDIPQTIDLGAPSMFAQDVTGVPITQNTAPNLEQPSPTAPSKYNSTMGTTVAAATAAAKLATNIASPYVEQKSIPKSSSVEAGTDMLGGIPIVGQFYGLGSAVGDGIAIGEDSLRAQGNDSGAEAVAGVRGAIDPASGWSQNAALYEAGIKTKKQASEDLAIQFFLPGYANASNSRAYDEFLANSWQPPQSATFSTGDGTFDGAGGRPVENQQFYGKYGGQMNQMGKSNLTHYNGFPHDLGGIPLKEGVEVQGGETGHEGFIYSDDITDPSTKKSYARMSKKLERQYKDKSDPRVSKDLDLVLEHLKGKQEAQKKIIGMPEMMEQAKYGGKYFGGGLIEPIGYTAAEVAAMGDADPFRVERNSPVPGPEFFTQATMNGNYDNPDVRPTRPIATNGDPFMGPLPLTPAMGPPEPDFDQSNTDFYSTAPEDPAAPTTNRGVGQNWGQLGLLGANAVASNIGNILGLGKLKDGYEKVTPETIQPQKQSITELLENIKSGVATARYNNRQSGRAGVGEDRALLSAGLNARASAIAGLENQYMASKLQSDQFNAQAKMQAKDLTAQNRGAFDTREQQIYDSLGQNISGAFGDYSQYTQNQEMRGLLDTYFEDYDYVKGKNGKYSFVRKGKKA